MKIPLHRLLQQVTVQICNICFIYVFLTKFSFSLASVSARKRAVVKAKKPTVTPQDCEDYDVDTHQASQSDDSSEEDLFTTAFTKVSPALKKGKKPKPLKGIYIHYLIHIQIKN